MFFCTYTFDVTLSFPCRLAEPHIPYIPQAQEKHIRLDAICLQGSEVILHDLGPTGESGSGCAKAPNLS